jgi:ATP-binding cassette subfamily B protein RaxB
MDLLNRLNLGLRRRLPVVLQSEAAECGLASLAMVAAYHGFESDLSTLRRRFSLSLKGANLARLMEIAGQLGLAARPLRLELDQLDQLKTPCVLHWNMNHFVVLKRVTASKVEIHDPAFGERVLTLEEASSHFTGIALELLPTEAFRSQAKPPHVGVLQLTGPMRGLARSLGQIFALSLVLQLFVLLTPLYLQWTIDQALLSGDRDLLAVLAVGFVLVVLFQVGIGAIRSWAVVYLSNTVGVQWNVRVLTHLLRLPQDWFEKRHLGDVVSRMGATRSIQETLSTSFVEAILDGLMAIATLTMMMFYSPRLAAITLVAVAIYLLLRTLAYRSLRSATEQQLVCEAKQQSHLLETIRGVQSVKLTGSETLRRAGWQNLLVETVNRDLHLAKLGIGFGSASALVFGLERVVVIWIGALLALDNVFSAGMLIAYIAYKDQFAGRMGGLIDKWIEFRMLRMHGERLADIILAPTGSRFAEVGLAAPPADASIEVKNLSFRYAEGEPWVLRDCSFRVEDGQSLAIMGASGCGKTTLVKLMLGLLTPSQGSIEVGGVDLSRMDAPSYRRLAAAVMQDDQLFAGSVAENIAFFAAEADQAQIERAAQLAGVHAEIAAMPMGYNTLIGDMGTALSGGQKQRIVLARALYRSPRILFLDEATSHLDVRRERLVNEALKATPLTKIIIAHRPETIASADRVLLLDGGEIAGESDPQAVLDAMAPRPG